MKFKKTYSFALISASIIGVLAFFFYVLIFFLFAKKIDFIVIIIFTTLLFLFSFFLIQYRVEKFIYQRVKKIYRSVAVLDIKNLQETSITSDMEKLSEEVQKFAKTKLLEIENLNQQALFRREYMGNVAHELKTPLFAIQSYLLTLISDESMDKKIKKKYLKRAEKNVERLVNIVEDLDFISNMDANKIKLNIQKFDIVLLINNILEMLEFSATKHQTKLSLYKKYSPVYVYADEKRIEQVLINLLTNSIKYAKREAYCQVKIEKNSTDKIVNICIIDQGDGIAKEHLPRLFERFYRVDTSRSRAEGGSGLGLSIVKHILEAHNQDINVSSELGEGTSFCFSLKLA